MKKETVLRYFGNSCSACADALGISRQAVSKWPDIVPIESAAKLQELTKGKRQRLVIDYKLYIR